jgi:hypothetical protein
MCFLRLAKERIVSNGIVKTSLLRTLFPRVPSNKELAERKAANLRTVVGKVSTGSILLQSGRYLTAADMEARRQRVARCK